MIQTTKEYVFTILTLLSNLFSLIMQALSLPPEYLNVRRMSLDNIEYEASQHLVHSRSLSILGEVIDETSATINNNSPQPSIQHSSTLTKSNSSLELSSNRFSEATIEDEEEEEESLIPESTCENIEVIIPVKFKERLSLSSLKSCKSESCLQLTDIQTNKLINREEPDETPKGRREPHYLKLPSIVTIEKSLPQDKFHQHLMKKTFVLKKSFSENHSSIELHKRLQTFKFPPSSSTSELCNYD
ncbi:predicted protein [Naegleria gruberi]|uniref:Predicted protein n=1 Tax=Naegleria gruberi TaxID=5762 RepID=D2VJG0_NAEGR|nr:uncharacterized protein NAEGRDRAFT_69026 [Naegleria gruberi]EFC43033.1 predicted protein [Naegleria gruberi]|eukprot:XP_002675777.1 predicted protein [Naegleria gruberi strain NEG-M]